MGGEEFTAAVESHHGEIYRYVRRMTARASEADDLAQETFLRAYRGWRALPPDANVRAWLFAIATNLCRNHFRDEKRRREAHAAAGARRGQADGAQPDDPALFNETRTLIEAVVARLPMKQRVAFTLRKLHDLDYESVGRSLDCSAETARAHVFQALRKIRQSLDGHHLMETERQR